MSTSPFNSNNSNASYVQSLVILGLTDKAKRAEEIVYKSFQRDASGDTWYVCVSWDSGMRSTRHAAEKKAKEQYKLYKPMKQVLGDTFGYLRISFPLSYDPRQSRGAEKSFIYAVRKLVRQHVPNAFDKIGTWRHGQEIILKVLSLDPLDQSTVEAITAGLPRGAQLHWWNKPVDEYSRTLEEWAKPDLPDDSWTRAAFEYVLDHIRQSTVYGEPYSLIRNKKLPEYQLDANSLKSLLPARPHNPKTGALAVCYTLPKSMETEIEDLDRSDWLDYVDEIEVDCTTWADWAIWEPELMAEAA